MVVVDPDRGEVVARIPVGKRPRGIKLSHDGKTLYVALSGSPHGRPGRRRIEAAARRSLAPTASAWSTCATHKLLRTLPSGQDPESFDLSRDGKTLYVSNEETAEMSVLDLASGKVKRRSPSARSPKASPCAPTARSSTSPRRRTTRSSPSTPARSRCSAQIATGPRPRVDRVHARRQDRLRRPRENGALVTVVDARKNAASARSRSSRRPRRCSARARWAWRSRPTARRSIVSNGRGESVAVIDVATRKVHPPHRRRGRAPLGHRRQPRRQAPLHRQRPVGRRLDHRRRDRQGREARSRSAASPGAGRRAGVALTGQAVIDADPVADELEPASSTT